MIDAHTPRTYVVVCRGPNCRERGSLPLRKRLAALLRPDAPTRLIGYSCFGQCDDGPNVAFFPAGEWYGHLKPADAEALIDHAVTGAPVDLDRLSLSDDDRTRHSRNIIELIDTLERDLRARATRRHWWWPFSARSSSAAERH